jgi:hypothetical protein
MLAAESPNLPKFTKWVIEVRFFDNLNQDATALPRTAAPYPIETAAKSSETGKQGK